METAILAVLLPLLKLAAQHAPEVLASIKKMFDNGIPTIAEIEAERAKVAALTLDDLPDDLPAAPPSAEPPVSTDTVVTPDAGTITPTP